MIRLGTYEDIQIIEPFDPFGGSREEEVSEKRLYMYESGEGTPIGYISTARYTLHDYPYVTFLLVQRGFRRRGIATELLNHIEMLHSGKRIFISTEADNKEMLSLLKKQQYQRSGSLSGLNRDGVEEVFFYKDCCQIDANNA